MQDLTRGSIARNLLRMTGFMLVGMIFQTLYVLVDLYFVGRLGKSAVAAVSLSGNLMFVVLAATQMLAVGATSLVAQASGRKDRAFSNLIFNQSQGLSLVVGAAFLLCAMALRGPYARGLAADDVTARLAAEYLGWFIPSLALQFAMVSTAAALRGTGNFKPGMLVQAGTVLLNIALAPALIFGWGTGHPLGVAGAALASFIAIAAGVLALIAYVLRAESYLRFARGEWWPRLALWGRMLRVGLPAGAEFALMSVYLLVVYSVSRPFGASAQAGFGIGLRIIQAVFLPVVALGFAASPVAGQNFGARLPARVVDTFRSGVTLAVIAMTVLGAACHLMPAPMIRVFSRDPLVVAVGGEYLRIIAWNFIPSGIIFVSASMFQALGNTVPSLIGSLARVLLLAVPVYLLSRLDGFQLRWIWYLSVFAVVVQMAINLLLLRREFRCKLVTVGPAVAAATSVASAGG
jgi:putative MATE family efflux protein